MFHQKQMVQIAIRIADEDELVAAFPCVNAMAEEHGSDLRLSIEEVQMEKVLRVEVDPRWI